MQRTGAGSPGQPEQALAAPNPERRAWAGCAPPCPGPAPGDPRTEHQAGAQGPCAPPQGAMPPPPPKPCGMAVPTGSLATSSQRETQTAQHSKLLSSEAAGEPEKDEYLLRLLRKGAPAAPASPTQPPPAPAADLQQQQHPEQQAAAAAAPPAEGFRAPGPVWRAPPSVPAPPSATRLAPSPARALPRATSSTLASPCSTAGYTTGATVPSMPLPTPSGTATTTDQAVPSSQQHTAAAAPPAPGGAAAPTHARPHAPSAAATATAAGPLPVPAELAEGFAVTRHLLGDEMAYSIRNTMIKQQVIFLEQVYDLHRAIAIQKLLMQNCPEVQQVMGEAMRLMSSVGSQHGSGSGRGSKRQRTTPNGGGATVPGSGSDDPSSFRPDSQFAAVPQLPGEAQTVDDDDGGNSGDGGGSGSAGANGSGGGSTSPQQCVPALAPPPALPYMFLAHTAVATPSGASAAPAGWPWGVPALHGQVQQVQAHGLPPVPRGPPQMAPWVGQDAGLAAVGINPHLQQHGQHGAAAPQHASTPKPAGKAAAAGGSKAAAAGGSKAATAAAAPAPLPAADTATATAAAPTAQQPLAAPLPPPAVAMPPPGMGYGGPMMMMPTPALGPMAPPAVAGAANPLSWWYQNYYGGFQQAAQQAQQQMAGGMSLPTAQAAAQAAAAFMTPLMPGGTAAGATANLAGTVGGTGTATATKWWHDPQLTFGPPVDTDMLVRRPAAGLAGSREGPEVQSALAGSLKRGPAATAEPARRSGLYSEGRLHLKRKAAADADEASSGTTGHTHPDACAPGPFKRQETLRARSARTSPHQPAADEVAGGAQDEKAAALLLAIGKH